MVVLNKFVRNLELHSSCCNVRWRHALGGVRATRMIEDFFKNNLLITKIVKTDKSCQSIFLEILPAQMAVITVSVSAICG